MKELFVALTMAVVAAIAVPVLAQATSASQASVAQIDMSVGSEHAGER